MTDQPIIIMNEHAGGRGLSRCLPVIEAVSCAKLQNRLEGDGGRFEARLKGEHPRS